MSLENLHYDDGGRVSNKSSIVLVVNIFAWYPLPVATELLIVILWRELSDLSTLRDKKGVDLFECVVITVFIICDANNTDSVWYDNR